MTIDSSKLVKCDECHKIIGYSEDVPSHICGMTAEECKLTPNDYQAALDVQSACNLGAVVHSFSWVMKKIQQSGRGKGTDWVNNHPIVVMYVTQLKHLSTLLSYSDAYNICEKRSKGE